MRTKISWAELHAPLFLAGTNLGQKLDHKTKGSGVQMEYDEERHHLYVTYNGKTARIPETSVLSMVEGAPAVAKVVAQAPAHPIDAQVSTPQSHVHAGLGAGQTGQEGFKSTPEVEMAAAVKRGPGRPPKT